MVTEFDRSRETVGGRSVTITSWYDDQAKGWRAGAPEYVHLLPASGGDHEGSSTRQQAVAKLAQVLARAMAQRRPESQPQADVQTDTEPGVRIHVGGLAAGVDREALETAFKPYGQVATVRIVPDRGPGATRPFAFVEMTTPAEAESAIEALHGTLLAGESITVRRARS